MKRFVTLATSGVFASALAVLPAAGFAQTNSPAGTDAKPMTPSTSVTRDTQTSPAKQNGVAKDTTNDQHVGKNSTTPGMPKSNHDKGA
ncbi:MAG: hypothetical protein JO227_00465 [Acetobacteraceae bacterium]|nr:hypothetical protein [Acetobacteraceae bacterium]